MRTSFGVLGVVEEVAEELDILFLIRTNIDSVELFGNLEDSVVTRNWHVTDRLAVFHLLLTLCQLLFRTPGPSLGLLPVLPEGLSPLEPRPLVALLHVPHFVLKHRVSFDFFVG